MTRPKDSLKQILHIADKGPVELFGLANKIRERHRRDTISLCAIVNAKSGLCSQDCIFCSQSARHKTDIGKYPLVSAEDILDKAKQAASLKASCFGIVISGKGIKDEKELSVICKALALIRKNIPRLRRSASLGVISKEQLLKLKRSGLESYHHNLETSEDFFPRICTTHSFKERLETIEAAKNVNLGVCSGGVFGLGETVKDRINLALTLKKLDVDSVPLNFLTPIKGTACESYSRMLPLEILKTIAIFRILLPDKDIKVCGGRNSNLRTLQSMIFFAGASGMMIGNYLTTSGNNPELDFKMIEDLELRPNSNV